MKKIYEEPNFEVIRFSITDDVLNTSPATESPIPSQPVGPTQGTVPQETR